MGAHCACGSFPEPTQRLPRRSLLWYHNRIWCSFSQRPLWHEISKSGLIMRAECIYVFCSQRAPKRILSTLFCFFGVQAAFVSHLLAACVCLLQKTAIILPIKGAWFQEPSHWFWLSNSVWCDLNLWQSTERGKNITQNIPLWKQERVLSAQQ